MISWSEIASLTSTPVPGIIGTIECELTEYGILNGMECEDLAKRLYPAASVALAYFAIV